MEVMDVERLREEYSPDELFQRTLEAQAQDMDEYWDYYRALIDSDSQEAFETLRWYGFSPTIDERVLSVDLLGVFARGSGRYHAECVSLLLELLDDDDPAVIAQAGRSLGTRQDPRAIEPLFALRHHPDERVRLGIVHGLSGSEDVRAISALLELSTDLEAEVRDWATFGLARLIDSDFPELREALVARLDDTDLDARGEAIVGLARRGDERVYDIIRTDLLYEFRGVYAVEAAEIIRATDLAPLVAAQRSRLPVDLEEQFGFYYDITLEALRQTMLYRQGILLGIASYLS